MSESGSRNPGHKLSNSEKTRAALLDATIESLVDVGYTATSTRSVANRAGVSQGALQYHFPNKAALVEAALTRLAQKISFAVMVESVDDKTERELVAFFIDHLWEVHNLQVAPAVLEMYSMARTDPDLGSSVAILEQQGHQLILALAQSFFPRIASLPGFSDQLTIATSLMRGTVLLKSIPGVNNGYPAWPLLKNHILESLYRFADLPAEGQGPE